MKSLKKLRTQKLNKNYLFILKDLNLGFFILYVCENIFNYCAISLIL